MLYRFLTLLALVVSFSACVTSGEYNPRQYDIKFGILSYDEEGRDWSIQEADAVPYVVGRKNQMFGYLIEPARGDLYKAQTNIIMPQNPLTIEGWTQGTKSQGKDPGIMSQPYIGADQAVMDSWFTPGDPKGRYTMQLFINDVLADERSFDVQ